MACLPPRPARHSSLPPHHSPHPKTPRARNHPPPQAAPSLLSCPRGVGKPRAVYAPSSRWERHLRKGTLGTERWAPLRQHRLSRYQWTFLESCPRLRLMAYSRAISVLHGMAFLSLAVSWLRLWGLCGFDAGGMIGRDGVGLVACGLAGCKRCVGPLHRAKREF